MTPLDLAFEEFTSFGLSGGFRSMHLGGFYVVMADGNVRFLNNDTDPKVQHAMLTAAGDDDDVKPSSSSSSAK